MDGSEPLCLVRDFKIFLGEEVLQDFNALSSVNAISARDDKQGNMGNVNMTHASGCTITGSMLALRYKARQRVSTQNWPIGRYCSASKSRLPRNTVHIPTDGSTMFSWTQRERKEHVLES